MLWLACGIAATLFAVRVSCEVLRGSSSGVESVNVDFKYDIHREVKVLFWTDFIPNPAHWLSLHAGPNCTVGEPVTQFGIGLGIVPTPDHNISDADVLVINLSELERHYVLPRAKQQGQFWVATCWEPRRFGETLQDSGRDLGGDCSLLDDPETMSWFDAVASYENSSHFPSFFTPPPEKILRRAVPDFSRRDLELAGFSAKDCRWNWRNAFVAEVNASLVAHGFSHSILSFSDCMRTAPETKCVGEDAVHLEEMEYDTELFDHQLFWYSNRCMSRPFHLVAENSNASWYVTEKVWNALAIGAIPVYLGTSDAKNLVPPGSTIFASDFASTDALVDHMVAVHKDGGREARQWKTRPVSEWGGWQHAREYSRSTLVARLCEAAAARPTLQQFAAMHDHKLELIGTDAQQSAGHRMNANPTMNPVLKQKGLGQKGAQRRALQGLAAVGDVAARESLDRASAERQAKGTGPALAIPSPAPSPAEADTPGWLNGHGHGCESYRSFKWCVDGHFNKGFEWTGEAGYTLCAGFADCAGKFNHPGDHCIICGKKAAVAQQLRAAIEDSDARSESASIPSSARDSMIKLHN